MATTSRFPDWCMFDPVVLWSKQFDASTILQANSDTSHGLEFSIGIKLADTPLPSRLHATFTDPHACTYVLKFELLVAHRDALLLQMIHCVPFPDGVWVYESPKLPVIDYFIYRIDEPSLERLPSLEGSFDEVLAQCKAGSGIMDRLLRRRDFKNIGFMCRGKDGFAVAELLFTDCGNKLPVLNVLHCPSSSSPRQWEVKHLRIIQPTSTDPDGPSWLDDLLDYHYYFQADIVVPFGDNYLCWAIYNQGILICDVFADKPELRWLQLAALSVVPRGCNHKMYQVVSVTKGGVLKLVMVNLSSVHAQGTMFEKGFTVTSWTLRATDQSSSSSSIEPWEWEQDGFLTSDELLHLLERFTQQRPCRTPRHPLISMDDPNVIYFVMSTSFRPLKDYWTFAIDMTNKTLVSSFSHLKQKQGEKHPTCLSADEADHSECSRNRKEPFLPAKFSKHVRTNLLGTSTVQAAKKMKFM